jgi:predicted  nucleic acid-binding Zn-ribbon protein
MDKTIRALTDLAAVDHHLSGKERLMEGLSCALEERRAALRATIPSVLLTAYDSLGRMGRHPVVVPADAGHCCGCYLRLPSQLYSLIRRRESLYSCPHCGRLLRVADDESATEPKSEIGDRRAGKVRKSRQSQTPRKKLRATRR